VGQFHSGKVLKGDKFGEKMSLLPYSAPQKESYKYGSKGNKTSYGFCHIKYCDLIGAKPGDGVQGQGIAKELYHENCVGVEGKKNIYLRKMC
jgi:hypothetical protein